MSLILVSIIGTSEEMGASETWLIIL
jgi:hypothetical protein